MKNGTLMRQVINKINGIDFNASDDRHMFGDIYEKLLKDLQSAGNAGEFYTPRAVTQFIVDQTNPVLGETLMDPAYGTGGFLTCAIDSIFLVLQILSESFQSILESNGTGMTAKGIKATKLKQLPIALPPPGRAETDCGQGGRVDGSGR